MKKGKNEAKKMRRVTSGGRELCGSSWLIDEKGCKGEYALGDEEREYLKALFKPHLLLNP